MTRKPTLPEDQLTELVLKARDGDRVAFNRLVDRFQPEILRMVYYRVRPHAEAEDLTQDIFLKAFRNIGNLRIKETDRLHALVQEIRRLGADAEVEGDDLIIRPRTLRPATIETYDDHRMAMSFALAGLRQPGVAIADPACVSKTWPGFFEMLEDL